VRIQFPIQITNRLFLRVCIFYCLHKLFHVSKPVKILLAELVTKPALSRQLTSLIVELVDHSCCTIHELVCSQMYLHHVLNLLFTQFREVSIFKTFLVEFSKVLASVKLDKLRSLNY